MISIESIGGSPMAPDPMTKPPASGSQSQA
jgi:hypothetical protein